MYLNIMYFFMLVFMIEIFFKIHIEKWQYIPKYTLIHKKEEKVISL